MEGREKLKKLGIELPIFPTTAVGSYPKPKYLLSARKKLLNGEITLDEIRPLEQKATREWILEQEKIGMDVLVDGEQYRGDMVTYFSERVKGFEISGLVRSYGNRYYRKPIIVSEIEWLSPITVEWWKFAQNLTGKPVKGMLTGPYTMMDWSFDEYYRDRKKACFALAHCIKKEVQALVSAGCKIIQIDEPAISTRPEELPFAIEAMKFITEDINAYFISHMCYGAFEEVYPDILSLPVDNLDIEMSNSELDLVELFKESPFTKDISFGVIDVHSHIIEDKETILKRMRKAIEVIPEHKIWFDPDCGLKTRTIEESIGKLKNLVLASSILREEKGYNEQ